MNKILRFCKPIQRCISGTFLISLVILPNRVLADAEGSLRYNSAKQSMELYNGTSWVVVGSPICSAAFISKMRYNIPSKVLEYCDGTNWQAAAALVPTPPVAPSAPVTPSPPVSPTLPPAHLPPFNNGFPPTFFQQ